jgi:transposase-like protein
MDQTKKLYQGRRGVHVPQDVKEYVIKRIKEDGKSVSEVAKEHGVITKTIYRWLQESTGSINSPDVVKLQKENHLLKQLVAELSLKIREGEKRGW